MTKNVLVAGLALVCGETMAELPKIPINNMSPYMCFTTNVTVTVEKDTYWVGVELASRNSTNAVGRVVQKSGTVVVDRPSGDANNFQVGGHGPVGSTGVYELQGGTLCVSNGIACLTRGKSSGVFRQTGGVANIASRWVTKAKQPGSRVELLGGTFVLHAATSEPDAKDDWIMGGAKLVFDGAPYIHYKWVKDGALAPASFEVTGTGGDATVEVADENKFLLSSRVFGKGNLVKTGKGDLYLRGSVEIAKITVREGRVVFLSEPPKSLKVVAENGAAVEYPKAAARDAAFPLRIAQAYGKRFRETDKFGKGHEQFDVQFADAGWPVDEQDKYPASYPEMARLASNLANYDVVILNTLWNHPMQGELVDMAFFADEFRVFLKRGGILLGADVGNFGWLKAVDPLLAVGKTANKCLGPWRAKDATHPMLSFPNANEGKVIYAHMTLPPEDETLFKPVMSCGEDPRACTIAAAHYGKGLAIIHSTWLAGPYGSLDETENYLVYALVGDKVTVPGLKFFHDWRIPAFAPGKGVDYTLASLSNRTDKLVKVAFDYTIASTDGAAKSVTAHTEVELPPHGAKAPVLTVADLPFGGEALVTCAMAVDGVQLPPKRMKKVLPEPFKVSAPAYRGLVHAAEKGTRVFSVDVNPSECEKDLTVKLEIVAADKSVVAAAEVPAARGRMRVPVSFAAAAKPLEAGSSVRATLVKDGKSLAMSEAALDVIEPQKFAHEVDDYGTFVKDGKPYFPRGIYHMLPDEYAMVSEKLGMNFAQQVPHWGGHPDDFLDLAQNANFEGLLVEPMIVPRTLEDTTDLPKLRELVAKSKGHPAMGWWYVYDEPHGALADYRARRVKEIFDTDKHHPTIIICNKPQHCGHYCTMADILGLDCYPVRDGRFAHPPRVIGDFVDEAVRVTQGEAPVVMVLPCFGNDKDQSSLGHETPEQLLNMAYQCLVHGCSGILWYANDFCQAQKDERMMAGLKASCDEIKALEPLLFNRGSHVRDVTGDIQWLRGTGTDGKSYLLAVNIAEAPRTAVVPTPGLNGGKTELALPACGIRKLVW